MVGTRGERATEWRDLGSNPGGGGRGFSDQLKGEIEGRADCKVREGLEEEETSFLPLIGITS